MKQVERVEVECVGCGKRFTKRRSDAVRVKTGRHFCSAECLRKVGAKPRKGSMRSCATCAAEFYARPGSTQRFCSKACLDQFGAVTNVCPTCGQTYRLKPSQKHSGSRFCSRACEARARIKRPLDREHNGKPAALDRQGYVRIFQPDHPRATKGGWIFEHRWVVEQALGRYLDPAEHVHHLNHNRSDNRPENLQVLSHSEHSAVTGAENGEALRAALELRQRLAEYERRFGPI